MYHTLDRSIDRFIYVLVMYTTRNNKRFSYSIKRSPEKVYKTSISNYTVCIQNITVKVYCKYEMQIN